MSEIPRRVEFSLTDNEKSMFRKRNEERVKKYIEKAQTVEQAYESLLIYLYYDIGMQDYLIYRDVSNKKPEENLKDRVKQCLATRAFDSARLQVLIDDMKEKGYDVDRILAPQIGEIFEYQPQNVTSPDMLYHGTAEDLELDQIGTPDEKGFYHIRDGISYWTTDYNIAKGYASDKKQRELMKGNVYSKEINPKTLCTSIAETHGGAFAMWQDELIKLNEMGVKYIFSKEQGRKDVLDIENFADFVQKRDDLLIKAMEEYELRLPAKSESFNKYFTDISSFEYER